MVPAFGARRLLTGWPLRSTYTKTLKRNIKGVWDNRFEASDTARPRAPEGEIPGESGKGVQAGPGGLAEPTLWDHLDRYLRRLNIQECTPATLHHKTKEIGLFLRFLAGAGHSMMAGDVTDDHILLHLEDMKERKLKPITRETRYRALHAWWNWMVDAKIADTNVVSLVPRPKVRREDKGFMTSDEFKKILLECDLKTMLGCRRAAMMLVLHTVAMKRNELLHLELTDLDWREGRILIRHGKEGNKGWSLSSSR